jgi:4-amino-4-deoxy-L-arabinose transferase-like glycosyltransferase
MSTIALPRTALPAARSLTRGRLGLLAVLILAALLCLWNLTISGYSNEYYAAAAKAAGVSWKAWFFGAIDPGSFITVDKPPLSLWLMGLSVRLFGFSSFSLLLPQALCTIAAVGLLHATVRRLFGQTAALLAATALALTPVTVAIARVNNPDALLALLLVGVAYLLVRALESGRTLVLCGVLVGLAFMTKMLQGWMIVPALAAAYLLAGPPALGARLRQLALAGAAMVAASAAWPLAVSLWPGARPYIGGSTDGSVWDLILGYNGFGRISGGAGGGPGAGGGGIGANFGGLPGIWRMFNEQVGGQIAWLLPFAAVSLAAGLWLTRAAPRTDRRRAGWVLFGVWALVHLVVFSFQQGIFHPYYASALAPAVAALCGAGAVALWGWARRSWAGFAALAAGLTLSAGVAVHVLARTPDFVPWLRTAIPVALALALFGALALRLPELLGRRMIAAAAVAGALALLGGPAAYSVASTSHALNGNNVTAGPSQVAGGFGMPGGGTVSADLIAYLQGHQGSAKYLVAASGSQASAPIIIATGEPVVTIGGFNGQDPAPTVEELARMVADGELRYVLLGSRVGGPGDGASALTAWVQEHGTLVDSSQTGGATLYRVGE